MLALQSCQIAERDAPRKYHADHAIDSEGDRDDSNEYRECGEHRVTSRWESGQRQARYEHGADRAEHGDQILGGLARPVSRVSEPRACVGPFTHLRRTARG